MILLKITLIVLLTYLLALGVLWLADHVPEDADVFGALQDEVDSWRDVS